MEEKKNKKSLTSNRVRLSEKSMVKVIRWQKEIEENLKGVVKINLGDIINSILSNMNDKPPTYIIKNIKKEKLDDIQMARWILVKLEESKKNGKNTSINELLKTMKSQNKKKD